MGMVTGWRAMGWDGVLFKNMQKIYEDMRKVMLAGPVEGSVHGSERQPASCTYEIRSCPASSSCFRLLSSSCLRFFSAAILICSSTQPHINTEIRVDQVFLSAKPNYQHSCDIFVGPQCVLSTLRSARWSFSSLFIHSSWKENRAPRSENVEIKSRNTQSTKWSMCASQYI